MDVYFFVVEYVREGGGYLSKKGVEFGGEEGGGGGMVGGEGGEDGEVG